jgi:hypothetical protein
MSSDSIFASRKTAFAGATSASSSALRAASVNTCLVDVEHEDERLRGEQPSSRIGAGRADAESSSPRCSASRAASAASSTDGSSFLPRTSFS